jgi:hypothetical protein
MLIMLDQVVHSLPGFSPQMHSNILVETRSRLLVNDLLYSPHRLSQIDPAQFYGLVVRFNLYFLEMLPLVQSLESAYRFTALHGATIITIDNRMIYIN